MPRLRFVSQEVLESLPFAASRGDTGARRKKTLAAQEVLRRAANLVLDQQAFSELVEDVAEGRKLREVAARRGTSKATESRRRHIELRTVKHAIIVTRLVDRLALKEGITIDPRTGLELRGQGYLVSVKRYGRCWNRLPEPQDALKWLGERSSCLTHYYPGSWYGCESGKYWLDMNRLVPTLAEALEAGLDEGQEAIFDLRRQMAIRVDRSIAAKAA